MARTHLLIGGVAAELAVLALPQQRISTYAIGGTVVVASALMPDIDHPDATLARTYGPLSKMVCLGAASLSGGHRHGTHSLLGVAFFAGMAQIGLQWRHTPISICLILPLILVLAGLVRQFRIPGYLDDFAPVPLVIGVVYFTNFPLWFVPSAIALGCLAHLAADMITVEMCPLLWPFSMQPIGIPMMSTNHTGERWVVTPLAMIGLAALPFVPTLVGS